MDNPKEVSNVHLLLVDDHARYLGRLLTRLEKFGYRHFKTASSAATAKEELTLSHFDVIVADMRMESDDSGFEIIDIVKQLKLSSIVIILTANDTVADCRKALKGKGAWDYISKTIGNGDSMQELHKSILAALDYFNQWGNVQDRTWINENMGGLLDNYRGEFVAVLNNEVIEHAQDSAELERRIIEKKLPLFLTVIEKIDYELFRDFTAGLIVFVEGPTDVKYIKVAMKIFGRDDLLNEIVVDTIGNRIGTQGGGHGSLKNGFDFLKEKRLITSKVLFLMDQDVTDKQLPNKGKDFENLYVRRIEDYSKDRKGIEWLLADNVREEGISRGCVEKTVITKITREGVGDVREEYRITDKTSLCNWVCDERENSQMDFAGFGPVFKIFNEIIAA